MCTDLRVLCGEKLAGLVPTDQSATLPAELLDFGDASQLLSEDRRFNATPRDSRYTPSSYCPQKSGNSTRLDLNGLDYKDASQLLSEDRRFNVTPRDPRYTPSANHPQRICKSTTM